MAFEPSFFNDIIQAGFDPVVTALETTFNGEKQAPNYLFRQYLTREYSVDGTFQSVTEDLGFIMADLIALDSPLPEKTRPAIEKFGGSLPKIGQELSMNETDLRQARLMLSAGSNLSAVQAKVFRNTARVYGGVLEKLEYTFLKGLSAGVVVADQNTNVGTAVRVNYQYQNNYNASVVWGQAGATPFADLMAMIDDASNISEVLMDRQSLNHLLNDEDAQNFVASHQRALNQGQATSLSALNDAFETNYGFTVRVITRKATYEINGVKTTVNAWEAGQIIGLTSDKAGKLVYSEVEEKFAPVGGKNYSEAEGFILLGMYRTIRPSLKEWTDAQAVALPVIDRSNVYKLDTTATA